MISLSSVEYYVWGPFSRLCWCCCVFSKSKESGLLCNIEWLGFEPVKVIGPCLHHPCAFFKVLCSVVGGAESIYPAMLRQEFLSYLYFLRKKFHIILVQIQVEFRFVRFFLGTVLGTRFFCFAGDACEKGDFTSPKLHAPIFLFPTTYTLFLHILLMYHQGLLYWYWLCCICSAGTA